MSLDIPRPTTSQARLQPMEQSAGFAAVKKLFILYIRSRFIGRTGLLLQRESTH
jgi:hypothetical protein